MTDFDLKVGRIPGPTTMTEPTPTLWSCARVHHPFQFYTIHSHVIAVYPNPINLHPSLSETPSFHIQSSEWQKLLPPKQIRPNSSSVNKAAKTSRLEPVKHRHMVHPQGQRNGWNNTDWFLLQNKRSYLPGQPGMSCPSNWNRFIQNPNPFCWFQDPHLSIIPVAKLFFSRWENIPSEVPNYKRPEFLETFSKNGMLPKWICWSLRENLQPFASFFGKLDTWRTADLYLAPSFCSPPRCHGHIDVISAVKNKNTSQKTYIFNRCLFFCGQAT